MFLFVQRKEYFLSVKDGIFQSTWLRLVNWNIPLENILRIARMKTFIICVLLDMPLK